MKYFWLTLTLTISTQVVYAQLLTFDNLIHLNELSTLEVDNYLVPRGWNLNSKEKQDSSYTIVWKYGANNQNDILLGRTIEIGQRPITRYCTPNRGTFLSMQQRMASLKLIRLGENLDNDGIATGYRGQRYEVWLEVHPPTVSMTGWYAIQVQQHGLVEGISVDEAGNQERIWLRPAPNGKGGVLIGKSGPVVTDESKQYLFPMSSLPQSSFSTSERLKADSTLRAFELKTRPKSQIKSSLKKRQNRR